MIFFGCSSNEKKTESNWHGSHDKFQPGLSPRSRGKFPGEISSKFHQNSHTVKEVSREEKEILISEQEKQIAAHETLSGRKNRKRKAPASQIQPTLPGNIPHNADSIRIKNIEWLRDTEIPVDFSEPLNKEILERVSADSLFQSAIQLSKDRVFRISFDNDIFDYTDQFYTNGIRFDFVAPALSDNPIKYILLPYWSAAINYYGLSVIQNFYTPSTTKTGGIMYGDRPYSAYLLVKSFKVTNDQAHHFRQTSELDLGVIGPASMGGMVQDWFHKSVPSNNEPLGWEYQIKNDAVVNYNFSLEKGIINAGHVQLIVASTAALGTLYTNIGGGLDLRLGWFNPYFSNLGIEKRRTLKARGMRVTQVYLSMKGNAKLVVFDATLEGGVFNRASPYTIPSSSISSMVMQSSAAIIITCGGIGIELEQNVLSPEFSHKWWHAWGHVGLLFAL